MRALIGALCALTLTQACGKRHDNGEAPAPIPDQAKPFYDEACASYVPSKTPRCDRSTFVAAMTVLCGKDYGLAAYEKEPGVWHRDVEPCYPAESSSECSRDAYLWVIFGAYKRGDLGAIQRIYDHATEHDWVMCEGDPAVTSIRPLASMIRKSLTETYSASAPRFLEKVDTWPDDLDVITNALSGFRGHLVAGYLWFRASVLGGLTTPLPLKLLADETPDSPWFSALYHRYNEQAPDQSETLELLRKTSRVDDTFGWGSSPWEFHLAATYQVLAGF